WRYAEEKPDRVSELAAELVRLKIDVIVSGGNSATQAAKKATNTIPIVMSQSSDPVASGFVASLAQPRGNITGLATLAPEIGGKQLELLKETLPRLFRVAVLSTSTISSQIVKELGLAAAALKVKLEFQEVLSPKDIDTAFRAASQGRAAAVLSLLSGVANPYRTQTAKLAVKS